MPRQQPKTHYKQTELSTACGLLATRGTLRVTTIREYTTCDTCQRVLGIGVVHSTQEEVEELVHKHGGSS
jgi:hypothetical protein